MYKLLQVPFDALIADFVEMQQMWWSFFTINHPICDEPKDELAVSMRCSWSSALEVRNAVIITRSGSTA